MFLKNVKYRIGICLLKIGVALVRSSECFPQKEKILLDGNGHDNLTGITAWFDDSDCGMDYPMSIALVGHSTDPSIPLQGRQIKTTN
jgi:hypothetical protein